MGTRKLKVSDFMIHNHYALLIKEYDGTIDKDSHNPSFKWVLLAEITNQKVRPEEAEKYLIQMIGAIIVNDS